MTVVSGTINVCWVVYTGFYKTMVGVYAGYSYPSIFLYDEEGMVLTYIYLQIRCCGWMHTKIFLFVLSILWYFSKKNWLRDYLLWWFNYAHKRPTFDTAWTCSLQFLDKEQWFGYITISNFYILSRTCLTNCHYCFAAGYKWSAASSADIN